MKHLSRLLRFTRIALFLPTIWFLYQGQNLIAFSFLCAAFCIGYIVNFSLRHQEDEHPYFILWIRSFQIIFSTLLMGSILYLDYQTRESISLMLASGFGMLLLRLIIYPMYAVSLLRENKALLHPGFWDKLARLSVTATLSIYVLGIEYYQEIAMGIMQLSLFASGLAFLYSYYRDADHRKPLSIVNQLTVSRIALTPVFIWVFFYDSDLNFANNHPIFKSLAFLLVVAFMGTDYLDGYLARKWNEVSTLGKYLDPFSDKISNMTIFLCFMASGYANVWMLALIYFREASVETLRTLAAHQNMTMPARQSGKIKTAMQGGGILIILLHAFEFHKSWVPSYDIWWHYLPYSCMSIITLVTLLSGLDYFYSSRDILKKYL